MDIGLLEPPQKRRKTAPLSSDTSVTASCGTSYIAENSGRAPAQSALIAASRIDECVLSGNQLQEEKVKRESLLGPLNVANDTKGKDSTKRTATAEEDDGVSGPQQYHCDACQKDISDVFRVRCAECADFDLCIACFCSGVETSTHQNTHSYIPIGRNDFSLFTPDWNADEEMMLLEGVSKFGFGNWGEVSDLVSPYSSQGKKKHECEEHYYSTHIAPYRDQPQEVEVMPSSGPRDKVIQTRLKLHEKMIGKDHPTPPAPILPPPPGASCNVVGYMPLRGDFDIEFDNDAELILSDIEFRGDETPQERELKLKILDIYNAKLDERILRKRVVIEKGLSDWRRLQQHDKRRTKEESDLHNLFRLLIRYDLTPDHEELLQLFLNERRIKERILMLQEWRSLGLQTYEEVEAYENSKVCTISGLPLQPPLRTVTRSPISGQGRPLNRHVTSGVDSVITDSQALPCPQNSTHPRTSGAFTLEAPASQYPGGNLLSKNELEFCDRLQIPPIYFLITKHALLRTAAELGDPAMVQRSKEIRLDGTKQSCLYDFILHAKFQLPETSIVAPPASIPGRVSSVADLPLPHGARPATSPTTIRKTRRRQNRIVDSPLNAGSPGESASTPSTFNLGTATTRAVRPSIATPKANQVPTESEMVKLEKLAEIRAAPSPYLKTQNLTSSHADASSSSPADAYMSLSQYSASSNGISDHIEHRKDNEFRLTNK